MSARYVQPLRTVIQYLFLFFVIWLGFGFTLFVQQFQSGNVNAIVVRHDGIEAFLPISGFLGTIAWLKGAGINKVHPAATVMFLTIIALSFLLRRSFCSWICPIGTISETAWKIGFKYFRRNLKLPPWLDLFLRSIKYIVLGFFVYSVVFVMSANAMQLFIDSDYHRIADARLLFFFIHISPFAISIIAALFVVSFAIKNPVCRYLCPYGALLGLVATLSPVRVTRDLERCISCGMCSQVCPSRIDVMHKNSVASAECIGCWRCVSYCRFNEALSIRLLGRYKIAGFIFALLVIVIFVGGSKIGKAAGIWHTNTTFSDYQRLLGK